MDDEFLNLVEQKIRARATPVMVALITRPNLRKHFWNLWEHQIKPKFKGAHDRTTYNTAVPFDFLTGAERRRRLRAGEEPPTITFSV